MNDQTINDLRRESERLRNEQFVIGAVRVNKPISYTKRDYETAAWHETHESETGIFKVTLHRHYHSPYDLYALAEIDAKVVDDYFPALWGGVPVSREPYKPKYVGQSRTIAITKTLLDAIDKTDKSHDSDAVDWFINPSFWHIAIDEAKKHLDSAYENLPLWWNHYKEGEDQFSSRVGMVAHFGEILHKRGKEIEIIRRHMGYLGMIKTQSGGCFIDLYNKNTAWARDFLGLKPFEKPSDPESVLNYDLPLRKLKSADI